MRTITVHSHTKKGKPITYKRTITAKQVRAAKKNIKKAREVWLDKYSSRQRKLHRKNSPLVKKRYKQAFG
jgi:hypothetical protein